MLKRKLDKQIGKTSIISTGQAGYIIKSKNGKRLGIDLYLSDYVERLEGHIGYKRLLPKLIDPNDVNLNVLIATHPHGDHYDKDSMPALLKSGNTILFASVNCRELEEEQNITGDIINYRQTGDSDNIDDFVINYVACDHGTGAPDAFGVVIEVDGKKIYEVGDSSFHEEFANAIIEKFKSIDILIGPINGAYGNMNEEEFAKFADIIKPEIAIPCHYGMFASHGGNPGKFLEIIKEKYPRQRICLMTQGEELFI